MKIIIKNIRKSLLHMCAAFVVGLQCIADVRAQGVAVTTTGAGGTGVGKITGNLIDAGENFPALVALIGYSAGVVFGALGLTDLKKHMDNPGQIKVQQPVARIIVSIGFFAIAIVYELAVESVGPEGVGPGPAELGEETEAGDVVVDE